MHRSCITRPIHASLLLTIVGMALPCQAAPWIEGKTLAEVSAKLGKATQEAYAACPFIALSKDYFVRFSRDPNARPGPNDVAITAAWRLVVRADADPLVILMAGYLKQILHERMGVDLSLEKMTNAAFTDALHPCLILRGQGGGDAHVEESFTITVAAGEIRIEGRDPRGLRDGVVKLVEHIGFRQAPILAKGTQVYRPRLAVRLGTVPYGGSHRDLVFMGYNAVFATGGDLHALSRSNAIPQLVERQVPGLLENGAKSAAEARRHGLKTYSFVHTKRKFPKDHPIFKAHPDIRGALTWKADGEYVLCTEHPLVKRYLRESVIDIFRADPRLDGLVVIVGGEGFYHCFMRSHGTKKGRSNCPRCDKLGAPRVVANLCNLLAEAARSVNPKAEVIAWPYSASHVWSADRTQSAMIKLLGPGTGLFTDIVKDETVTKPHGVRKLLWDYSIDLIGPGSRAKQQIELCRQAGISVYVKSEPELGFEAPRLPHIPCLDRWIARADVLATCGATGAWVFPAFRPCYGTSAAESYKLMGWDPAPKPDEALDALARRIAGSAEAASHLREAWRHVSDAIAWSPELPPYYTGPYYLGPAHPMCADPKADVPEIFNGLYLFHAEITDADGLKRNPTYFRSPRGDVVVFGKFYRKMEALLARAVRAVDAASPLVPERCRLMFASEESPTRWFYHTCRTHANFYESCRLRDALLALAEKPSRTPAERAQAAKQLARWREVLLDERANTRAALPVIEADARLDCYYGGDHTFAHTADMMRVKLERLDHEIDTFLPSVAKRCGVKPP